MFGVSRLLRLAPAAGLASLVLLTAGAAQADEALRVGGAALQLDFDRSAFAGGEAQLLEWVRRSADIVAHYYGRFPTPRVTIHLVAQPGGGVHGGKTFADPNAFIRVQLGREVSTQQLLADWVLVHEMTHLALPDTGEAHAWLSEGLATYVEGVARVQAGNRSEADVWAEEMRAMPRGLPEPGDQGLDRTHTWGRTYWGGAMFCLLADVTIRRRTGLRLGLQDALRAILRESGGLATTWPIERVLRTGDDAVGTNTLEALYTQMKEAPVTPDLMSLWRELGIVPEGNSVALNDDAPLAPVRHAIMRAR